jgi:hypothetical protein
MRNPSKELGDAASLTTAAAGGRSDITFVKRLEPASEAPFGGAIPLAAGRSGDLEWELLQMGRGKLFPLSTKGGKDACTMRAGAGLGRGSCY